MLCAPGWAEQTETYVNDQKIAEDKDVTAVTDVVADDVEDAGATAGALGNSAEMVNENGAIFATSVQDNAAGASATATIDVGSAKNAGALSETAANSLTIKTTSRNEFTVYQDATGPSYDALSSITGGSVDTPFSSATATGNAFAADADNGTIAGMVNQNASSNVTSDSRVTLDAVGVEAGVGARSVGNAITTTAIEAGSLDLSANQLNAGALTTTIAALDANYVQNAAVGSIAAGNSITADHAHAYVFVEGSQENTAYVRSDAVGDVVYLDEDLFVTAEASGNTAAASTIGAGGQMILEQVNLGGGVDANAVADVGQSGAGAVISASATAFGNAQTVTSCGACGELQAYPVQHNGASVTATSTVRGTSGLMAAGSAFAAGNVATFQATRANN